MQVKSAWVKPPPQVGGLDHLAVQAPCINIYGRLLPGITNVTDRARYYSFYPWLIWAFDQAGFAKYDDGFIERFRRADCLFSLIAERHAVAVGGPHDNHAAAIVGSNTLNAVASALDDESKITLSHYSLRNGAKARYFANRLGGLGQYYLGVLRELNVLDGDTHQGIKYTRQIGGEIATRVDAGVNRKLFLKIVESGVVSRSDLDKLSAFCPCRLANNEAEQSILADLFFVRGPFHDPDALPRRRSLQSLLNLTALLSKEGLGASEEMFRGCAYSGHLPSGTRWEVAPNQIENQEKWAVYARNEILSIAVQGLFHAVLDAYEESGLWLDSGTQVADWFVKRPETQEAIDIVGRQAFSQCVTRSTTWLPEITQWQAPDHEVILMDKIVQLSRGPKSSDARREIVAASLRTMIALAYRSDHSSDPYLAIAFDKGYFDYYPINLRSFAGHTVGTWSAMPMEKVLQWTLTHWCIELHLRVALRKLRGQSQSTFRIRPSERGMEIIAVPPAVHTRPRFSQAIRILKDIGALDMKDGAWFPSCLGRTFMELGDAP